MNRGARYPRPMLWLYGRNDPFYSLDHSRGNFEAFRAAGGKGRFFGFQVPGGNGHGVVQFPRLWAAEVDRYLVETEAPLTECRRPGIGCEISGLPNVRR